MKTLFPLPSFARERLSFDSWHVRRMCGALAILFNHCHPICRPKREGTLDGVGQERRVKRIGSPSDHFHLTNRCSLHFPLPGSQSLFGGPDPLAQGRPTFQVVTSQFVGSWQAFRAGPESRSADSRSIDTSRWPGRPLRASPFRCFGGHC